MCGRVQAGVVGPLVSDAQRHLGDRAVSHVAESGGVLGTRIGLALGKEFGEVELLPRLQFADGILGEHHHAERADGFGDAVVDFGVDVVGTTGEHDASAVVLFHIGKRGQTFLLHVMLEDLVFGVGGLDRGFGLFAGHVGPRKLFDDAVNHELMVGKVEVRVHVTHVVLAQLRHVGADDERIVGHNRAVVMIVRVGHEVLLVAHARVEDGLDALVDQPLDMAVDQLGRVADVFGSDGFDAGLEQFMGATAGNHHLEAQRGEQREPERVVLVHIEGARNADLATSGLLVGQTAVGEATLVLVVVQVRTVGTLLLGVTTAFATVTGHEARTIRERGDSELAVVLAQLAHVTLGGHAHIVECVAGQDGAGGVGHTVHDNDMDFGLGRLGLLEGCGLGLGLECGLSLGLFLGPIGLNHHIQVVGLILIVHAGGQGGAERAHEAGDVRAGDLTFGEQLEGAQHGVVEERTALDHHSVAEFAGITQLDDLVQGVTHHGVAQPCGDVLDGRAFLLRLLDRGVHEHSATRAKVHRMGGCQSLLREFLNRQAHGHGEGLQERTTAGRAGLVDGDRVDNAIGDGQVLHILAADVDDGGDAGADHFGATIVGHGLHHALVQVQAGGDEAFAVSGGAGACDPRAFGQLRLNLLDDVDGGGQRAAFVVGVAGPDDFTVVVDECGLDGGGTGVDAQEVRAMRAFKGADVDVFLVVALVEVLAIGLGGKQRRHGRRVGRQVLQLVQTLQDIVARVGLEIIALIVGVYVGLQCRTVGHVQVGVGRHDEFVDLALKRALECGAQFRHEEQWTAEEDDGAVNRASGSQTSDGLRGHCSKDGGGQIGLGRTIVDERLQIGFGEHTTTRSDRIQVLVALGHLVKACGVSVKQRGHLVNERAGTTCARTVHALFGRGFQVGDFGVLAAELDDDIGLRVFLVDCLGFGDDLLNERHMQIVSKRQTAGTGDRQANRFVAASEVHKLLVDVDQQAGHGGTHVGVVASVIGEEGVSQGIGLIKHHGLDGGGTDVQSHTQGLRV